jgi:glutaredoxin
METLDSLKERFKKFVKNVFDELGVLVDEFDFDFSEKTKELYREINQNKTISKKFEEVDFVLNISLSKLGKVPYQSPILFSSCDYTENNLAIYARYRLENGIFV